MDEVRAAPTAGIVASLLTLVVLAIPYALVGEASAVTTYYGSGAITPLAAGLFALVGVIVFAAGREDRSDPAIAAGTGLVFGLFISAICALWALTVPASIAVQLVTATGPVATLLEYHRFLLALVSASVLVSGAWYARALRLV